MGVLVGVDVDHPAALVDLHDPAYDNVAYVRSIARPERTHANDSVNLVHNTGHRCENLPVVRFIGAVA
jgi:hypothetical protein